MIQVQSDTGIKPPKIGEFGPIGLATPNVSHLIQAAVDAGAKRVSGNLIVDPWGTPIHLVESERLSFHHLLIFCSHPAESGDWYTAHLGGEIVTCPWNTQVKNSGDL